CNLGGKKYKYKLVGETKKLEYTAKNLKKDRYYKYYIAAYKLVDGKKIIICVSKTIHATTTSEKNGSAEKIKLNKNKVTLSVDEKFKIIAREINKTKTIKTHRPICYESSDPKVAKVDKKGKITAKKCGKCNIWVYAQNGLYVKVSVTVK
ncbi:MAG: Ig-like domain-containing protein, partial [Eubacterium sp.]|nr:Ig-like domain-containing protein [Eubacterium sp.]